MHHAKTPVRPTPRAPAPRVDFGGLATVSVTGPDGRPMSRDDLPPPNTRRWVVRRKAQVVAGVRAGLITLEEACARYSLSVEEFLSWQKMFDRHGLSGLRTTRLQKYRDDAPPPLAR